MRNAGGRTDVDTAQNNFSQNLGDPDYQAWPQERERPGIMTKDHTQVTPEVCQAGPRWGNQVNRPQVHDVRSKRHRSTKVRSSSLIWLSSSRRYSS
jgi:hypothetical protein